MIDQHTHSQNNDQEEPRLVQEQPDPITSVEANAPEPPTSADVTASSDVSLPESADSQEQGAAAHEAEAALPEMMDETQDSDGEASPGEGQKPPKKELTPEEIQEREEKKALKEKQRELAAHIADTLGETEKIPRRKIEQIVTYCGVEFTEEVYKETLNVEANGGMMIESGERRRTPGGVFFYLIKGRLTAEQRRYLFPSPYSKKKADREQFPPFEWENRHEIISQIRKRGGVEEVRVKIIGRPGDVKTKNGVIITQMTHLLGYGSLPAQLPPMPEPAPIYTLYIAHQQWKKVAKFASDETKLFEVDGIGVLDPAVEGITIFVTAIKTRIAKGGKDESEAQAAPTKPKGEQQPKADKATANAKPKKDKAATPAEKPKAAPKAPPPAEVVVMDIDVPEHLPADVKKKVAELQRAAQQFQQKINALEAKPENKRFGLEMTQKLLANTQRQITTLLEQYK